MNGEYEYYMYIGQDWITTIGQYTDSSKYLPALMEMPRYTITVNDLFEIDAEKSFKSYESAEKYVKSQIRKKCKELLKELGDESK